MIKKYLSIILLLFIALSSLSACGAGSSSSGGSASSSAGSGSSPQSVAPSAPAYNESGYDYASTAGEGYYADEKAASADSVIPADRKVIRNASLDIMAEDAAGLYGNIAAYATGLGGYEYSYSVTNHETYSIIFAEFKIPPEKLNAFIQYVGERGEIINSSMNSEDITESYFDAETRLDTKRKSLERYYDLLANASSVEEIVYIQRIIDGITEDIESLEGRLKVWNSQVNMATVNMYIRQENDPLQIRKEISWNTLSVDDMGYLIRRGFYSVSNTIMSLLQWLVIALIGYSPLWIILAAGVFLWFTLRKRSKAKSNPANEKKDA
ncbi:MAG: DUF4349 domain-containing protein [Clostridiales bacterium]|nr:DUF4349 domain-containing protein [Clostridiales bacterium]